jgi:hypothetical protein
MKPIYEEGILAAGRRPFLNTRELLAFTPKMIKLGAALPLYRSVSRHFEHERIREAFSFHSLFIGGDPFRVPRSTARSSTCSSSTRSGTPAAGRTRSSRRWRARSTCAAVPRSSASSTARAT